ncbi:MAG TPA: tetratricopeptide repeat protein [Candidatus Polarisedimenticolaceae bacterium]|nr:tetratricopeptide repeat protein [Candidatus Polarisedimenticolaceae bacterium]
MTRARTLGLAAVLMALALAAPAARAQQARFQGKVTDTSGQPVAGATIHLEPAEGTGNKTEATTRKKGDFILGLVRPGNYKVTIDAPGGQVITAIKAVSRETGPDARNKEPDWTVDQKVGPGAPVALEFKDGHEITAEFVVGSPQAAAAAPPQGGDPLAAVVQKVQGGDCAGALPDIEAARTASPENARAHYLAAFCLERTGDHEKALAAIDQTLQVQPEFAGGSLLRGRVLRAMNRTEEAEAAFKKEIETTQHDSVRNDAWGALAVLYKDAGRTDDAIAAFEKIVELQPQKGEAYTELSALYGKKGDRAKQAEALERAKQAGASVDPAAMLNVGIGHMNSGKYPEAVEVFRRIIDSPDVPAADLATAWGLLGRCQLNANEMDEGMASLQKAIELDPSGSMAEENKQILAALQEQGKPKTAAPKKK